MEEYHQADGPSKKADGHFHQAMSASAPGGFGACIGADQAWPRLARMRSSVPPHGNGRGMNGRDHGELSGVNWQTALGNRLRQGIMPLQSARGNARPRSLAN